MCGAAYTKGVIILGNESAGALAILVGGILWGTSGTAQALLSPMVVSPMAVGAMRLGVAGGLLLLVSFVRRGTGVFRGAWPWGACVPAAFGMALFQICFFSSLRLTGVAIGTMVAVGSAPIAAGVFGRIFFGERLTLRWGIATLLAVAGCCLLSLSGGAMKADFRGILLAALASVCYALCGIGIKGIGRVRPSEDAAIAALALGALVLSPFLFTSDMSWIVSARGAGVAFHMGAIATALPYSLFSWGLQFTPMSKAYTLTLTEPLTAFLLGVLFLGEPMSFTSACGVALLLAGLLCLSVHKK